MEVLITVCMRGRKDYGQVQVRMRKVNLYICLYSVDYKNTDIRYVDVDPPEDYPKFR